MYVLGDYMGERIFYSTYGRVTVKPFKLSDIENMMLICKKNRNEYESKNKDRQRYMWDRNYMILKLGINLAFRIEDLLQLRVKNVKNGYIYTREHKTNKEQTFTLNKKLNQDIVNYINRNNLLDDNYLFISNKGVNKPITRVQAWRIVEKLAEEVKVDYPIGCHSLRKCFARTYYEQTGDLIGLSEMLNHSSPVVTLRYICWDNDTKNKRREDFYIG